MAFDSLAVSWCRRWYAVALVLCLPVLGLCTPVAVGQTLDGFESDTSRFVGDWIGSLTIGGTDLRVVFHLRRGRNGELTGTMDSPDQGAAGISVGPIAIEADTLRLRVSSIAGAYAGVVSDSTGVIDGVWVQGGRRMPLVLERTERAPTVDRPQEPTPPFPYKSKSITFRNTEAGVTLRGTLTRPDTEGPVPGVVLVAGSGPSDRDATIMGHKPFLVLSDALTRRGLAVLRFDERGVGASGGQQEGATSADLAGDVTAAVQALAQERKVDGHNVGIIGHGEGGLIAPMVATMTDQVSFLVLLAAPGLPGRTILADQLDRRIRQQGATGRTRALQRGTQKRIFDVLQQDADSATIANRLRKIMIQSRGISGEETIRQEIERLMDPWLRYFIAYDPRPVLQRLEVPVLALAGAKDQQVDPDAHQSAIAQALDADENPQVTVRTLEGLNHLFQTADTGAPEEYGRIKQTFSPKAIDVIVDWITAQGERSSE